MDMFSYSIVENNEVFFMREQARQLWKFWNKAKAQAVPEWISVEDHLPEEGQEVIVHHFGHVVQATKDKNYVGGFKQRNCYGWECVSSYISHWQPKNFKLPDNYSMYYTDESPYKETLANVSGAEG
ncbi:DUF551 domain-containing protein [Acinetobacter pittii]|uniref:DUF551 domain-containing protein n=2 Tax=Acinetobacter pittii TaxID=48296 RepID=A0AB37TD61_ACIPI|nr:hypothetical protein B9X62_03850 [Acinetobacter pittii]RSO50178.1 DUF551 domain-containing protein [Acinetobacter pittii]RSO56173.1 DUF551 domain-containing protein [Acinetobacter pittii]